MSVNVGARELRVYLLDTIINGWWFVLINYQLRQSSDRSGKWMQILITVLADIARFTIVTWCWGRLRRYSPKKVESFEGWRIIFIIKNSKSFINFSITESLGKKKNFITMTENIFESNFENSSDSDMRQPQFCFNLTSVKPSNLWVYQACYLSSNEDDYMCYPTFQCQLTVTQRSTCCHNSNCSRFCHRFFFFSFNLCFCRWGVLKSTRDIVKNVKPT